VALSSIWRTFCEAASKVSACGRFCNCSAKSASFCSAPPSVAVVATTSSTVTGSALTVLAISATSTDIAKPSARTVLTNIAGSSASFSGLPKSGAPVDSLPLLASEYSMAAALGNASAPPRPDPPPMVERLEDSLSSAEDSSVDFVGGGAPRIFAMSGSSLTRCSICFRSTRASGFRKSSGDWTTRYSGMVAFNGKCRASVAYPTELSTECGSVLLSSKL
jgi:hypothetical protein